MDDSLGYALPKPDGEFEDEGTASAVYDFTNDVIIDPPPPLEKWVIHDEVDAGMSVLDDLDALLYILEERHGIKIDLRRSN